MFLYRATSLMLMALLAACQSSAVPGEIEPAPGGPGGTPRSLPKPYVGGDQGDCMFAPENTLVAMRNAVRIGVDVLEADVNITSDGVPVLIHDATLDRTTNCTGNVKDKTLAQVRACDAAYWWVPGVAPGLMGLVADPTRDPNDGKDYALRGKGVTLPTVREYFDYVLNLQKSLGDKAPLPMLEIKNIPYDSNFDPTGQIIADALVPLIEQYGLANQIIIESFWPTSLARVKQLNPQIKTLFLTLGSATENYVYVMNSATEASSSDTLAPDYDQTYVDNVHALGKAVVPWLVDTPADLDKIKALGADGLLTCHAACLLERLGRSVPRPFVTPEAGVAYDVPACP